VEGEPGQDLAPQKVSLHFLPLRVDCRSAHRGRNAFAHKVFKIQYENIISKHFLKEHNEKFKEKWVFANFYIFIFSYRLFIFILPILMVLFICFIISF